MKIASLDDRKFENREAQKGTLEGPLPPQRENSLAVMCVPKH
jgi:hypothetical protein